LIVYRPFIKFKEITGYEISILGYLLPCFPFELCSKTQRNQSQAAFRFKPGRNKKHSPRIFRYDIKPGPEWPNTDAHYWLDTAYVEDPVSGNLQIMVSDPRKPSKTTIPENNELPKDTAYVEDPLTGELHIIVMTRTLPSGNWKLYRFENEQDEEMERLTMQFDISGSEKSISGNDGCNAYGANITKLTIYEIAFSPARSTKRACLLPAKYAEPFYKLLGEITQYDCTGKIINLKDAKGYTRMQFKKAE
jgi:heat shock protein HslJ